MKKIKDIPAANLKPDLNTLPVIGKGVVVALVISMAVFVFSSVIISYTPVSESVLPYLAYLTSIISIIVGAFYVIKRLSFKGWLNGGLTGLFYVLVLLFLGRFIIGEFPVFSSFLIKAFLGFAFGAVSGIVGRNI